MKRIIDICGFQCLCCTAPGRKIAYVLYPMNTLQGWIESAAERYGTTIVVVTGMDWESVFSPWPAPGVPKGSPDFKGQSPQFLKLLQGTVLPQVESVLGMPADVERTLVGVSMSGLFALWQWMLCDTFRNIASLSGSFWYEGFTDWMKSHHIPGKSGRAFFLLGDREPHSRVKAFSSVGTNTQEIIGLLEASGINTEFRTVPGDHFADPVARLDAAFKALL